MSCRVIIGRLTEKIWTGAATVLVFPLAKSSLSGFLVELLPGQQCAYHARVTRKALLQLVVEQKLRIWKELLMLEN